MNQKSFYKKIAFDMFSVQMKWTLWFLGILFLAQIVLITVSVRTGMGIGGFLIFSHGASKIYMLVIGILSAYAFLTYLVHHGVTRKDYFTGTAIAAVVISFAITLFATIITGLETFILESTGVSVVLNNTQPDMTVNIVTPKSMLESSILVQSTGWLISLVMFALNILTYHVIGWLIGMGFYRFGWLIGLGFIVVALLLITISDLLWGTELDEPLSNWLPFNAINLPVSASIIGTIVLIGIVLWVIRAITRNVTIKM